MFYKFNSIAKRKDYESFNEELLEHCKDYCDIQKIDIDGKYKLIKLTINPDGERTVAFIAGIHGDEIAGTYGILDFIKSKIFIPKTRRIIIIPIANPSGFELNTRKNQAGEDINRKFLDDELKGECKCIWDCLKNEKIELLHSLHEDLNLKSFYCYYTHHRKLANEIKELASKYFKIFNREEWKPLDGERSGDKVVDGLIPPPHVIRGTIEDKMLQNNVPYITTETPGKRSLSRRTKFNSEVIKLVINEF